MNVAKRTFNPLLGRTFRYSQAENADLEYVGNWGVAVQPETVESSTWTVERGSVTISDEAFTGSATSAKITGEPGESTIVNKVVLSSGETDERIILLKITDNDIPFIDRDYGFC